MCVIENYHVRSATGTQPPTQAPLSLNCSAELLQESEQIRVSCTGSRDFATLMFECSQNGQSISEGCELCQPICNQQTVITRFYSLGGTFPLLVSYAGQSGGQTISITATGTDGARFTNRITFDIPSKPHLLFDLDDFI